MPMYFFEFRVVGEIADMLKLNQPEEKLLVDISSDLPGHEEIALKKYPTRTTLTILGHAKIKAFLEQVSIGDVVEASGAFSQGNYIPYKTTCIDTVFLAEKFTVLKKTAKPGAPLRSVFVEGRLRSVH